MLMVGLRLVFLVGIERRDGRKAVTCTTILSSSSDNTIAREEYRTTGGTSRTKLKQTISNVLPWAAETVRNSVLALTGLHHQ